MAYRFDAGVARASSFSSTDNNQASDFRIALDAGSQAASIGRSIAPASVTLDSIHDLAVSPFAQFAPRPMPFDHGTNIPPVGGDDVPDDNSSTIGLNVQEGQAIQSSINHPQDQDWFVMTLSDGQTYDFTMAPGDTSGTGPDFKIGIYDASGTLIVEGDSGGMGGEETLSYTATGDGTYYVAVSPFTPADIGAYTLTGAINNDPSDPGGTPLAAINWGGNDNKMEDDNPGDGVTHIKVYYGQAGEFFGSPDDPVVSVGWDDFAKDATFVAFQQYENVVNVQFEEVTDSAEADWVLVQTVTAPVLLGQMRPPNEPNEGLGDFNKAGVDYDEASCQQGGFSFITFIHEFGHGMGMAHPHDTGGGSEVMHGVEGDVATGYTTGDFGLNQGVYTTMSYNDGWPDGPEGTSDSTAYGYQGTLMALDVAMMQIKYGANMNYNTGNDTYLMPDVNAPGTMYKSIWDAGGGNDVIRAAGSANSTIDLRAATLQYEEGGGGFISHTDGVFGGFTIANGVVIEGAKGAKGDDTITGNDVANRLGGGAGADTITGGLGADEIEGGKGIDTLYGGADDDTFVFAKGSTHRHKVDLISDLTNDDTVDLSAIDANTNVADDQAFILVGSFSGAAGELTRNYNAEANLTLFRMDDDGDGRADLVISVTGDVSDYANFIL